MIIPVILAGGSGTRLWPLSRKLLPKQFISLVNETSLFQDTLLRLPLESSDPIIICNEDHRFIAAEQARQINKKLNSIILEPTGKNTAPAITLAALRTLYDFDDPILLVLPADHLINNKLAFHQAIITAKSLAEKNHLVTFGVKPNKPETGYGYIEAEVNHKAEHFNIKSFTEKPNKQNATKYLESGNYLWNSGIFIFKASIFLDEINKFEPKIFSCCEKSLQKGYKDLDFLRIDNVEFAKCPNQSVDYAVMEKTQNAKVVPLDADWNDVGSWDALIDTKDIDQNGNTIEGDVILDDVQNTYINSSNNLVAAIGVSDLIIVETQDALLVTSKKNSSKIKNIVNQLKVSHKNLTENHPKVYRPWGYFESIDIGLNFHVKRILINPKSKISLQKHKHRSEHWVIINGIARITCHEETYNLEKNQSTYIPKGALHRLENISDKPLEIIEIQTGSYLGEDDIIRIQDDYNRS